MAISARTGCDSGDLLRSWTNYRRPAFWARWVAFFFAIRDVDLSFRDVRSVAMTLIRSAVLTNFAEVARSVGLDSYRLLADLGLPQRCLLDSDLKVPIDAVRELLERAAQRSGIEAFGLPVAAVAEPLDRAAQRSGIEAFGLLMAETRQLSNLGMVGLLVREQPTVRL